MICLIFFHKLHEICLSKILTKTKTDEKDNYSNTYHNIAKLM